MTFAQIVKCAVAACLVAVTAAAGAATPSTKRPIEMNVGDIQECMRANLVDRAALRDLSISAVDREGKAHALRIKLFWKPGPKGQIRVNLRLVDPPTVRGSSYLMLQKNDADDVYFYLPGADRALHLGNQSMSEPMWNTDFSYAEMKQVVGLLASGSTARADDTVVAGRPAYQLQTLTLVDEDAGTYTRVTSAVDQATCTLLRSEFYAKGDQLAKVLEADTSKLLTVDTYSVVLGYTMRDVRAGSKTTVELSDFTLLERMPESLFEPQRFFEPFE